MSDSSYGNLYQGFIEKQGTASSTDGADHLLIAAPPTGSQLMIGKVSISNTSATDVEVQLKSGSTVIWTHFAPKAGGNEPVWPHPIHCSDAAALNFACSTGVSTVTVSASGFQRKTPLSS
jgi:hypothetical protein